MPYLCGVVAFRKRLFFHSYERIRYTMSYYDETPSPKEHSDTNETRRNRSRRYATMSMMCGIFAFFSLFLSFSAAILLGMSANVLFVLSKEEGQPRRGSAVVGLILGVMSTIFGVVEFFCLIQVYHMITDPQYAPFFDQAMELYESLIGPLQ